VSSEPVCCLFAFNERLKRQTGASFFFPYSEVLLNAYRQQIHRLPGADSVP